MKPGRLRVYIGAATGVGATYAMLDENDEVLLLSTGDADEDLQRALIGPR
jgi:K+-sensing histidine kinase KdpD